MRVEDVVAKAFNLDTADVTDASSKETIAEWDSMGHLSLITSLEERYNISLAIADAMEMTTVAKVKAVLKQYGVSQ
jgi:acyl carrier protein